MLRIPHCLDNRLTVNCEILATCSITYGPVRTSQKAHSVSINYSYPRNRPWRPIGLWDVKDPTLSFTVITLTILDIIHCPVFYYSNVSETGFCLGLQVEPTQLGPIDRAVSGAVVCVRRQRLSLSVGPNWAGYNIRQTQNPVSETSRFK
jgi:hypothetical protein